MYVLELAGTDDRFAVAEAGAAAADAEWLAPGLATADALDRERLRGLAFSHRGAKLVGTTDADPASAAALLAAAPLDSGRIPPAPGADGGGTDGPGGATGESGNGDAGDGDAAGGGDERPTVAVRARDVRSTAGVSTSDIERRLGDVLVDRGFAVDLDDPDHELRALFARGPPGAAESDGDDGTAGRSGTADADDGSPSTDASEAAADVCALGWLVAEREGGFGDRAPTDRPFFQPGSMAPRLARALCNLARIAPGETLLDPMCGTGGVLVEACLLGARGLGIDAQAEMAAGARENLATYAPGADWGTARADATALPIPDGGVDAVVFDAPYGRQSKIVGDLDELVGDALAEARRVAARAVVVGDRSWAGQATTAGWTVEAVFRRRVHGSLTRHVAVLS